MPEQQPIERAVFRESEDGTTIFFPWGLTHRGYQLTDEAAKKRAARAAPGAALLLALVSYSLWISRFVEQFPDSDLKVPREVRLPGRVWRLAVLVNRYDAVCVAFEPG